MEVRTFQSLVDAIAEQTEVPKAHVGQVLTVLCDEISVTLQEGKIFRLRDVGNLRLLETKERKARNPQTGETFTAPAGHRVKFSVGSALKALAKGEAKPKAAAPASKQAPDEGKEKKAAPQKPAAPAPAPAASKPAKPAPKAPAPAAAPKPAPKAAAEVEELEKMLNEQ